MLPRQQTAFFCYQITSCTKNTFWWCARWSDIKIFLTTFAREGKLDCFDLPVLLRIEVFVEVALITILNLFETEQKNRSFINTYIMVKTLDRTFQMITSIVKSINPKKSYRKLYLKNRCNLRLVQTMLMHLL